MRIIAEYHPDDEPLPRLRLYIHGAPHYRQHYKVIQAYRKAFVEAFKSAAIKIPITVPIDLWVLYINPCSPDLYNLALAMTRAMDKTIIADDSLIAWTSGMGSYYPNRATRADQPFRSRFFEQHGA
jgi:Holliday junction resolvase RusA-like endonuclease